MPWKQAGFAPIVLILFMAVVTLSSYVVVKDIIPQLKNHSQQASPTPIATSSPSPTPSQTPTPTSTPKPVVKAPVASVAPACIKVKTYGTFTNDSEFEAEKCYTPADADLLDDAIRKLNNASFNYNGAAGQANVTCQGFTESFKQQCDQSKQDVDKYKAEIDKYKGEIRAIMARGK